MGSSRHLVLKMPEEVVQPVYIVIEKTSEKSSLHELYKTKAAIKIGIVHILCGLLAFIGNIGLFFTARRFHFGFFCTGIWTSVFFFISGGLSICSGKKPNSCLVISTMVMSIFSSISAGVLIIFSSLGINFDYFDYYNNDYYNNDYYNNHYYNNNSYINDYYNNDYYNNDQSIHGIMLGLHILQLLAGTTGLFLSITSSSFACKATCCSQTEKNVHSPYIVKYSSEGRLDEKQMEALDKVLSLKQDQEDDIAEVEGKNFKYNKF